MRVLIAGASGFLGTALVERLTADGHEVVRLVRRRAQGPEEAAWSPAAGIIDFTVMDRVDAVVNLSGASLARLPWTKGYQGEIVDSRVTATRTLADAMRKSRRPPAVFLSASAVGYYGDRPGELLTEFSSAGSGFLAEVVQRWEGAAALAPDDTRTVVFRTGIVVGHGGAMQRIGMLTRFGLSSRLGTGGQHWPWIALDDEIGGHRPPAHLEAVGARQPRRPDARDRRPGDDGDGRADAPALHVHGSRADARARARPRRRRTAARRARRCARSG